MKQKIKSENRLHINIFMIYTCDGELTFSPRTGSKLLRLMKVQPCVTALLTLIALKFHGTIIANDLQGWGGGQGFWVSGENGYLFSGSWASADPEGGGQVVRTPLENHKLYGFL